MHYTHFQMADAYIPYIYISYPFYFGTWTFQQHSYQSGYERNNTDTDIINQNRDV